MQGADALEEEVRRDYQPRLSFTPPQGAYALILGHSSSGKTTAAQDVALKEGYRYIYDSSLLVGSRFEFYTTKLFIENDSSYYFPYEAEAVLTRFLQNLGAARTDLCDQGIHSIWAYARALVNLGRLDAKSYQSFFSLFLAFRSLAPWPGLVVRFRCAAQEARRRVERRNRPHELAALGQEFIGALDIEYELVVQDFPESVPRTLLDTTELSKVEAAARLREILGAHFATEE